MPTNYSELVTKADYYTFRTDRPFLGILIRLKSTTFDQTQYAEWSGSDAGCATFDVDLTDTYVVSTTSKVRVDGRHIRSMTSNGPWTVGEHVDVLDSAWTGVPYTPTTVHYDAEWNLPHAMLLAGAQAMARYDYNTSLSYDFQFRDTDCCYTKDYIYAGKFRYRMILYEFGHAVGRARDEGQGPNRSYGAPEDGCNGYSSGVVHTQNIFWDVSTNGGVHPDDVASIWDGANPKNWKAKASGGSGDLPSTRIIDSCASQGFATACNNALFNGITH